VNPAALDGVFADLNAALPGLDDSYVEFDAPAFLARLGVSEAYHQKPYDWSGWTAGLVRRAAAEAAATVGAAGNSLLSTARTDRLAWAEKSAGAVGRLEVEAADLRRRIADRHRRAVLRAAVPDAPTLEMVTRYEAHLSRQMLQALHTLERLQVARAGVPVAPPAAVDVTIDGLAGPPAAG
jgi:hypothetical protein